MSGRGADLTAFVRLPHRLYRGHPGYHPIPDLLAKSDLNPKEGAFHTHGEAAYWLARRGERVVGRVSAQVDRAAIEAYQASIGFFGFLDAEDDPEVFAALIAQAEGWLKAKGMRTVWGPLSHSLWEAPGQLIENFTDQGVFMMPYSPPYQRAHVEAAGYAKVKDLDAWIIEVGSFSLSRKPMRLSKHFTVRTLNEADYAGDIRRVVEIFNDAWSRNWGFVPFSDLEIAHLAKALKPILDPNLVIIVEARGVPAAMSICLPNVLEAVRDLDGRLAPFGWAKLLYRLRANKVETARTLLMGLRREFHDTLFGATMLHAMFRKLDEGMLARRFKQVEMSWILEDNIPMIKVLENIGGRLYKKYRVYEKPLV